MSKEEKVLPTIRLTHQRVTSLQLTRSDIDALLVAEVIRRAVTQGVVIDLTKGERTGADVNRGNYGNITVTITEDMTLDADR